MKKLIYLVVMVLSQPLYAKDFSNIHFTTHVAGAAEWSITFPAIAETKVFRHFRSAVQITSVKCDGVELTGRVANENHDPDLESLVLSGQMLYSCRFFELYVYQTLSANPGYFKTINFEIPNNVRKLEIEYRIRFPDGKISEPSVIVSYDRSSPPFRDEPKRLPAR